jgi:hypothetical protein
MSEADEGRESHQEVVVIDELVQLGVLEALTSDAKTEWVGRSKRISQSLRRGLTRREPH